MKRILAVSFLLALASLTSGCGLKGRLERPAPLWGSERQDYLEQQKQAAAAKAGEKPSRPRVEIPVSGGAAESAPSTSAATANPADLETEKTDFGRSGGAVPPVKDRSGMYSGY